MRGAQVLAGHSLPAGDGLPYRHRADPWARHFDTDGAHRVGDRPGRWEPAQRERRPKPGVRLGQPRAEARLPKNRSKWF